MLLASQWEFYTIGTQKREPGFMYFFCIGKETVSQKYKVLFQYLAL
jgi:hypothetical protein